MSATNEKRGARPPCIHFPMRTPLIAFLLAAPLAPAAPAAPALPYQDPSIPVERRIDDLLGRMTLEEKVSMLGGDETGFNEPGVPRLGIPPILMTDGPVGIRTGAATAYPASICTAASWDTDLAGRLGSALAEEVLAKGKDCLLGPCVDIGRFPLGGRNFESFGEDPFLSSRLAAAYIRGVQSRGVIATVKHFACNDQERDRNDYDVQVDERTLREIHLPAFEAAVKDGRTLAVMSAYNQVNGQHCSENRHLLLDILKGDWGFQGIVMSDWVSVYSTENAANNGLDLEMPQPVWFGAKLLEAVRSHRVAERTVDEKVRRLLRVRFLSGIFDRPAPVPDEGAVRTEAHRALACAIAESGMVLLKNDGLLPLSPGSIVSVALIGPCARTARTGGGGSSQVVPWETVSPYEGLAEALGPGARLKFAEGVRIDEVAPDVLPSRYLRTPDGKAEGLLGEYFDNTDFKGSPVATRVDATLDFDLPESSPGPHPAVGHNNFSIRWTGKLIAAATGTQRIFVTSDDGSRLYLDGKLLIDNWGTHGPITRSAQVAMRQGEAHDLKIDYFQGGGGATMRLGWADPSRPDRAPSIEDAVRAARAAQVAIVCVGNTLAFEGEGNDVQGMELPGAQGALVEAVAAANPNTVVVLFGGTPLKIEPWLGRVRAVLAAFYPGQEGGRALARVLTGAVNPSGKLPFSYIRTESDSPAWAGYCAKSLRISYGEGVFVGYRYYEKNGIRPLFPFGYGLSYTRFRYDGMKIERKGALLYTVRATITNTGPRDGAEVVELYVSPGQSKVPRPPKELKAFAKVNIPRGASAQVTMSLDDKSFRYFDPAASAWTVDPGTYEILLGSSSQDIRLRQQLRL